MDNKTFLPEFEHFLGEIEHFLAVQSAEPRKTDCQFCGTTVRHKEVNFLLPSGISYTIHLPICPLCDARRVTAVA